MSVGHLARLLEDAGIATVIVGIRAFRDRLETMSVPRAVVTPYVMGRTIGPPHRSKVQRATIRAALDLLVSAERGGTIVDLPGSYRPLTPGDERKLH